MIKKTITFEDFDGNEQTEEHYFNLTKAELLELEMINNGQYSQILTKIGESEDGKQIVEEFKKILKLSYGVRSEDGKRFIKSDELFKAFSQTGAYSELYFELATDAEAGAVFVNGLIPASMVKQLQDEGKLQKAPSDRKAPAKKPAQKK